VFSLYVACGWQKARIVSTVVIQKCYHAGITEISALSVQT
jgi:hypothetical protein